MNWRSFAPSVAIVAAVALFTVVWPLQRAINQYSAAQIAVNEEDMCIAAGEVARGWAGLRMIGKYDEWKGKQFSACTMARIARRR